MKSQKIRTDAVTVLFLGMPGSGRSTQAELLKKHLEKTTKRAVVYVSAEEALQREECIYSNDIRRIEEDIIRGNLIAHHVFERVCVVDAMKQEIDPEKHWILVGAPKTMIEAWMLCESFTSKIMNTVRGNIDPILLEVSATEARKRLLARGGKRDSEEEIAHRLALYDHHEYGAVGFLYGRYDRRFYGVAAAAKPKLVHKNILRVLGL